MAEPLTGGCACSTVRYRLNSDPFDVAWCHCRICQRVSGAPAMVFGTVPAADFVVISGAESVHSFRSSGFGTRRFCGACGTSLTMQVDHEPTTIDVTVASLDDPAAVTPEFQIFWGSRIEWFEGTASLPRHERFRRDPHGAAESPPQP